MLGALWKLAEETEVPAYRYSRNAIRDAFAEHGVRTKYEIAEHIAAEFPELAPRLPPPRKCWLPEDPRMGIFDAASLAVTYFATEGVRTEPPRMRSRLRRFWGGLAVI